MIFFSKCLIELPPFILGTWGPTVYFHFLHEICHCFKGYRGVSENLPGSDFWSSLPPSLLLNTIPGSRDFPQSDFLVLPSFAQGHFSEESLPLQWLFRGFGKLLLNLSEPAAAAWVILRGKRQNPQHSQEHPSIHRDVRAGRERQSAFPRF